MDIFVTTFGVRSDGPVLRVLKALPTSFAGASRRSLLRRHLDIVPADCLHFRPALEILRTAAGQLGSTPRVTDAIWDLMSHDFTRHVASRVRRRRPTAVYAYEYTAKEAFDAATVSGAIRVLDLPSLSSRGLQGVLACEAERFPALRADDDRYFVRRFARRQARRDAEIAQADLIVCNSTITRNSHVAQGADADRIIVVPLAAPPTISAVVETRESSPLHLIWAGTFGVRKGAHYLIEACRGFRPVAVRIDVFGAITLPNSILEGLPKCLNFHGSVPRDQLFREFEAADALIFPTLSDGFGMVVTEAFSRGLPVITTNRAGAADLVRHGENGLIIPAHDSRAIVESIEWCLDNRRCLASMRLSALATAKARQWPDYRRELIAALDGGLRNRGFPASLLSTSYRES